MDRLSRVCCASILLMGALGVSAFAFAAASQEAADPAKKADRWRPWAGTCASTGRGSPLECSNTTFYLKGGVLFSGDVTKPNASGGLAFYW